MAILPRISYSLTRDFQWNRFDAYVYAGIVLALSVLVPLNVALTGYQVVSSLNPDYGVTQSHWFDRFTIKSSQSLCDPHRFAIGESFITNQTIFNWKIASLWDTTNTANPDVSYTGGTLDSCDVVFMAIDANVVTWTVTFSATVECQDNGFPAFASTTFTSSPLVATSTQRDTMFRSFMKNKDGFAATNVLNIAGISLLDDLQNMVLGLNNTTPVVISAESTLTPCPRSLATTGAKPGCDAASGYEPPQLNITDVTMGMSSYVLLSAATIADTTMIYNSSVSNALQTLHAAIRLDLGNALPNNLLTNTNAVVSANQTILPTYPLGVYDANGKITVTQPDSVLYDALMGTSREADGSKFFPALPLDGSQRSIILVPFLCHFREMKSTGEVFIEVLVATWGMFSVGWAVFIRVCSHLAKKGQPEANQCDHHHTLGSVNDQPMQLNTPGAILSTTTPGEAADK
ncbi:hypothetical protein FRB95_007065 [Tulasnella sp. JGI-2019a]|nr:hypothetical protein FRB95_007065 [Tulasnella sp. JGI-2019a]